MILHLCQCISKHFNRSWVLKTFKAVTVPIHFVPLGHFSQIVWKNTKKVGFGRVVLHGGRHIYITAYYSPPGNISSQYKENVPPPISGSSHNSRISEVDWWICFILIQSTSFLLLCIILYALFLFRFFLDGLRILSLFQQLLTLYMIFMSFCFFYHFNLSNIRKLFS